VTREELRLQLWPVDTFVDYEHSLDAAINKLRDALNDSADNPRFIQTIPRRGYRFISSVEAVTNHGPKSVEPEPGPQPEARVEIPERIENRKLTMGLSDSHDLPDAPRGVVQILFSLIQVMYLSFYFISLARLRWVEPVLSQAVQHPKWIFALLILTALVGIPLRLYLLTAALFGYRGLPVKFLRLFPLVIPLDELWALSPFLLVDQIGVGLALAATAALLYLPFSQRSLMLMGDLPRKRTETI
jgi:cholera toxin transcriptional activator